MLQSPIASVETRASWRVAVAALVVMTMAFGGAWITPVALKDIAAEAGGVRSVPALATALIWLLSGAGGILMGRLAHRFGTRWTVLSGATMIGLGLALSTRGVGVPLWIGHGLLIGLLGLGGINAPLYVYVTHWFDRRRGSALALISSGSYLAGAIWPPIFERVISHVGWRETMLIYAVVEIAVILPLAGLVFRAPPKPVETAVFTGEGGRRQVFGWPPNLVYALMCAASILCCVTMSMPQQHLVAFCSDLGFTRTFGALMLTVLLGTAFVSRQVWGAISDRFGGLNTVLIGSAWQASAMTGLLFSQDEVGLITASAAFGLGFSGIIPAYVLTLRELYPAAEAYWRIPTLLMFTAIGMGGGGWLAGILYDHFGYYTPAFAAGIAANLLNLAIIGVLALRRRTWRTGEPVTA